MAVYNITITSKTMAGKDTTQDANRSHNASNYTWVVSNGKSHQYYYNTSAPVGKANFHVESTLSTIVDSIFKITTGLGDAVEITGDKSAYFRGNAYFAQTCFVDLLKSAFFPATTIQLTSNSIDFGVGIKPAKLTTAQRTAISPTGLNTGLIVEDTDTSTIWRADGTNWIELG